MKNKGKGVLTGSLIRKLDESKPSNPVWIVRFDNGMKDQAMPEKSFGRVVPSSRSRGRPRSTQSDNSSSMTNSSDGDDKVGSATASIEAHIVTPSEEIKQKSSKKKSSKNKQKQQSSQSQSQSQATVASASDTNSKNIKSAEEDQQQHGAGINTRSSSKGKRNYASLDSIPVTTKQPSKKSKKARKEECVKVQYNRGTLYLYRGENPRAMFKWNF